MRSSSYCPYSSKECVSCSITWSQQLGLEPVMINQCAVSDRIRSSHVIEAHRQLQQISQKPAIPFIVQAVEMWSIIWTANMNRCEVLLITQSLMYGRGLGVSHAFNLITWCNDQVDLTLAIHPFRADYRIGERCGPRYWPMEMGCFIF